MKCVKTVFLKISWCENTKYKSIIDLFKIVLFSWLQQCPLSFSSVSMLPIITKKMATPGVYYATSDVNSVCTCIVILGRLQNYSRKCLHVWVTVQKNNHIHLVKQRPSDENSGKINHYRIEIWSWAYTEARYHEWPCWQKADSKHSLCWLLRSSRTDSVRKGSPTRWHHRFALSPFST
jgi:hypothetical protein